MSKIDEVFENQYAIVKTGKAYCLIGSDFTSEIAYGVVVYKNVTLYADISLEYKIFHEYNKGKVVEELYPGKMIPLKILSNVSFTEALLSLQLIGRQLYGSRCSN